MEKQPLLCKRHLHSDRSPFFQSGVHAPHLLLCVEKQNITAGGGGRFSMLHSALWVGDKGSQTGEERWRLPIAVLPVACRNLDTPHAPWAIWDSTLIRQDKGQFPGRSWRIREGWEVCTGLVLAPLNGSVEIALPIFIKCIQIPTNRD